MSDAKFLEYINNFMQKTNLPQEAAEYLMSVEKKIFADTKLNAFFKELKADYMGGEIELGEALAKIKPLAEEIHISSYTLDFIFMINCTDELLEIYRKNNISEEVFWDTMDDFRCKLIECYEVKGVWGTFVDVWFGGFLDNSRHALGRFQYEKVGFGRDEYNKGGVSLKKDDIVYNFHIPSSKHPFDTEARLNSYRKAYEFYGFKEKNEPIVFVCSSWLLYPEHHDFLPKTSNILSFMSDFDIIDSWEKDEFSDAWRVFASKAELPVHEWPEDTSLRRAFKKRVQENKKTGGGYGVIVFDGEKIINR